MGYAAWKRIVVNSSKVSPYEYWRMLPSYKFVLSPSGLGAQSPKTFEALSTLTIPIVHSSNIAYKRLRDEGWPLAVVDDWNEVTPRRMNEWWKSMSPKLEATRRCMHAPTFMYYIRRDMTMNNCTADLTADLIKSGTLEMEI